MGFRSELVSAKRNISLEKEASKKEGSVKFVS